AEDGIRDRNVTGVQTCALPICNHCEILQGNARFVDEHTLALDCPDGSVETLTAEKFVIACGSRPYHPTDVDFTHPRIYDSDSILSMHHEPRHVLLYGAGVIGCE